MLQSLVDTLFSRITQMKNIERNLDSRLAYLFKVCYVFFGLTIGFVLAFILWANQSNKRSEYEFAIPPPSTLDTIDYTTCPVWSLVGDGYCDDEANIVECGYDFKDCCHLDSDRSLCTDCFCYIPEEEKILLDEEFNKNCPHEMIYAWGDGICDLNL